MTEEGKSLRSAYGYRRSPPQRTLERGTPPADLPHHPFTLQAERKSIMKPRLAAMITLESDDRQPIQIQVPASSAILSGVLNDELKRGISGPLLITGVQGPDLQLIGDWLSSWANNPAPIELTEGPVEAKTFDSLPGLKDWERDIIYDARAQGRLFSLMQAANALDMETLADRLRAYIVIAMKNTPGDPGQVITNLTAPL